jgi:hypothetical protein
MSAIENRDVILNKRSYVCQGGWRVDRARLKPTYYTSRHYYRQSDVKSRQKIGGYVLEAPVTGVEGRD